MLDNHYHTGFDFKGIGCSKIGYFKEVRDKIRELEQLNISLAQRRSRLEAIFNSMSDGLTILDRHLNIVFANKIQKQLFPDHSLINDKCYKAYYCKEMLCKDCPSVETMKTGETLQGEILVRKGNLAGSYIEWTTSPIGDAKGRVAESLLLMRDVTQRKEYELKLMQSDRMAAIGFLAAGVAHEINNPLTSIAGFSEGLLKRLSRARDNGDEPDFKGFEEYLSIIQEEAYRCKAIIQNLQAFSRNSGDEFEPLAIDRIIQDTVAIFRQRAKDSRIEIRFGNGLIKEFNTIIGKESQLKHLFLNLFNHAFLCVENHGRLEVIARTDDNQVEIHILHSGCAHPERFHTTLFDPSYTSRSDDGGHAIDLSICHNIVQHHQGDIQFTIHGERQAAFTLRFPLHVDQNVNITHQS
jgi:two-component system NtrC family sensor kinase